MDISQVPRLAELLRDTYSPAALDPGVTEPTMTTSRSGARYLRVPRDQQEEPLRSINLLDARAVGPVLALSFSWNDDDDGTVFVMLLDARDVDIDLDLTEPALIRHFMARHVEHSLGAPRPVWEPEAVPLSRRMALVHPVTALRG